MKTFFIYIFSFGFSFLLLANNNDILILEKIYKTDPTKAIIFADSLLLTNKNKDSKYIEDVKYFQAFAYEYNNNHQKSLDILEEISLKMDKNSERYVRTLLSSSNSNEYYKNHSKALSQAIEALDVAVENNYFSLIASANSAISFIYYSNNDYLKSLEYLQNSVKLFKEQNDSILLSSVYNNIAIVYKNIGQFEDALDYNNKSLKISKLLNDKDGIGKSFSNIGRIYADFGHTNLALEFYKKAITNNISANIKNSIPYRNSGDIYMNIGQYVKAQEYYYKSLDIEKDNKNISIIKTIYEGLLKTSLMLNDFKKALDFKAKIDSLAQLNLKKLNDEKILMLENQHKLYQNKKKLKQLEEINTKNKVIFGVVFILILTLVLFWIQYTRNNKLKLSQEKILLEQKVLRSQMNPHFIFNVLSAIQNSLLDNDPIKSASYLSKFAKLIRQNFDFINQKNILLSEEIDALKNYIDTQKLRFNDKFDYEINIFADIDINNTEIPPLLIQPFVENAIEHGFKNIKEKGSIIINIYKEEDKVCYEIKDNGKGFINLKNDNKIHSIDIFKKRLKLLNNNDEKSIVIKSTEKGTRIKFCLKQ